MANIFKNVLTALNFNKNEIKDAVLDKQTLDNSGITTSIESKVKSVKITGDPTEYNNEGDVTLPQYPILPIATTTVLGGVMADSIPTTETPLYDIEVMIDNTSNKLFTKASPKGHNHDLLYSSLAHEHTLSDLIDAGQPNGVATLDEAGKVPANQLPSFVDDVLEFPSLAYFPLKGESGKIFIAIDTNKSYRWGGTIYVEIASSVTLGETDQTAYRGDRGKIAFDLSNNSLQLSNTTTRQWDEWGCWIGRGVGTPSGAAWGVSFMQSDSTVGSQMAINDNMMYFRHILRSVPTAWFSVYHSGYNNIGTAATNYAAGNHAHVITNITDVNRGWDAILRNIPSDTATRWPNWDEVSSKPATFAPSSHRHPWSQLDGVPATFTPSAHGNHVPTTQTASNTVFLRNDNTWASVKPENIGAALASHNHTLSNITDIASGTCAEAVGVAAKTLVAANFVLSVGAIIVCTFTNGNTAINPTLNVNGTGAKPIFFGGAAIPTTLITAKDSVLLCYNGTSWNVVSHVDYANSTTSLAFGGTGVAGTSSLVARADHTHTVPNIPGVNVATSTVLGTIKADTRTNEIVPVKINSTDQKLYVPAYPSDYSVKGDITSTTNLNDIVINGIYSNPLNANASIARNFPIVEAGALFNGLSAYGSSNQMYGTFGTNKWFVRGSGTGVAVRTPWQELYHTGFKPTAADVGAINSYSGNLESYYAAGAETGIRFKIDGVLKGHVGSLPLFSYLHNNTTLKYLKNCNDGTLRFGGGNTQTGARVFTEDFKPTATDVGAINSHSNNLESHYAAGEKSTIGFKINGVLKGYVGSRALFSYLYNSVNGKYIKNCDDGFMRFSAGASPNGARVFTEDFLPTASHVNTMMVDGFRHYDHSMKLTVIDATALDSNTFYPVTLWLDSRRISRMYIGVALDSGKPSWGQHSKGFSCYCNWTSIGDGYGTTGVSRTITDCYYRFADQWPIGNIYQMTQSSNEIIYVRGGGKYYYYTDCGSTPILRSESYTENGQTVSPFAGPVSITKTLNVQAGVVNNSVVQRDGSGQIWGSIFNSAYNSEPTIPIGGIFVKNGTDNYMRLTSPANFISKLNLNHNNINNAATIDMDIGTVNRKVITTVRKNNSGYISRTAIGTLNVQGFNPGLLSVGTDDAGTTWTDFVFYPSGRLGSKLGMFALTSETMPIDGTEQLNANVSGSGSSGGLSLYGRSMNVGVAFRSTANNGTHGHVGGDWATYLFMDWGITRGWIFNYGGSNIASINGQGHMYLNGQLNCTNVFFNSDIKLKENIKPFVYNPSIFDVPIISYNYKSDEDKKIRIGSIAQDLQKDFPEFVSSTKDDNNEDVLNISYPDYTLYRLRCLEERISQLENELRDLKRQQ